MKILLIGAKERFETYLPQNGPLGAFAAGCDKVYLPRGASAGDIQKAGAGARGHCGRPHDAGTRRSDYGAAGFAADPVRRRGGQRL